MESKFVRRRVSSYEVLFISQALVMPVSVLSISGGPEGALKAGPAVPQASTPGLGSSQSSAPRRAGTEWSVRQSKPLGSTAGPFLQSGTSTASDSVTPLYLEKRNWLSF